MAVNIHHAKTHLSKLIAQAEKGEDVIIARNGKPVVKLVPVAPVKRKSLLGALKGKFTISDDFHLPDPEIEDLFYNSQGPARRNKLTKRRSPLESSD